MNITVRRTVFISSIVMVGIGLSLSSLPIGLIGLLLCLVSGWPKNTSSFSSSVPPEDEDILPQIHTLLLEFFTSLVNQNPQKSQEQQNFLASWKALSVENTQSMINLLKEAQKIFDISCLPTTETLSSIQKAFYKLPYLRILLLNVIEKTEEATNTLIERFISVSEKNRQAIEEVKKRIESHQGESLSNLIAQSSEITQNYELMKEEYETLLSQNKIQIEDFTRQLQTMFDQLKSINDILGQNKIIAVNLSIEGVKFGDKGRAIKVIVREIQKLNQKIDQFTGEVSHRLEQFEVFNKELWQNWLKHMGDSVTRFQIASENASRLMEKLKDASQHMNDIASLLQQNATAIQKDLDTIVESLQFQDITRQQIENVMSYLGQIQEDIKKGSQIFSQFGITFDEWDIEKMDEAKNDMVREAKVSSERFLLK
ncbi:MAG: methyl-accepting chemotaxis protein [Brevinematales bacterium]